MKKLLLIIALFVTVNGMAQDTITFSLSDRIRNVDTNPFRVGTVVLDENNAGAIRNATFLEELEEYLKQLKPIRQFEPYEMTWASLYRSEVEADSIEWTTKYPNSFASILNLIHPVTGLPMYEFNIEFNMEYEVTNPDIPAIERLIEWLKEKGHRK